MIQAAPTGEINPSFDEGRGPCAQHPGPLAWTLEVAECSIPGWWCSVAKGSCTWGGGRSD
jgi:hypothetical protein